MFCFALNRRQKNQSDGAEREEQSNDYQLYDDFKLRTGERKRPIVSSPDHCVAQRTARREAPSRRRADWRRTRRWRRRSGGIRRGVRREAAPKRSPRRCRDCRCKCSREVH